LSISNEFITLIAKKTRLVIVNEIKKAGYYSISVDSTPDISHIDQLTIIIRYVTCNGPVERFLTFINIENHTGKYLAPILLEFMVDNEIDINLCRGQSYDNASNMSGPYSGMQAIIKANNPFADFISCTAHSLNLVGQSAVDCCVETVSFFGFVQELYNFFSVSTSRWSILKKSLDSKCPVPKSIAKTRWSANAEAIKALSIGYKDIYTALVCIKNDEFQKQTTRQQSRNLIGIMSKLETGIICELWNDILGPFNICSKSLQSINIDLCTAINLMKSLKSVLDQIREKYDNYEFKGMEITVNKPYKSSENRKRKKRCDNETAYMFTDKELFKVQTFYVIIDKLNSALQYRIDAYKEVENNFRLLSNFSIEMKSEQIEEGMKNLCKKYPIDFPHSFKDEFKQFITFTSLSLPIYNTSNNSIEKFINLYKMILNLNVSECFPNVEKTLRLYLTLMCTNCSGERSLSRLKLIKKCIKI